MQRNTFTAARTVAGDAKAERTVEHKAPLRKLNAFNVWRLFQNCLYFLSILRLAWALVHARRCNNTISLCYECSLIARH